MPSPSDASRYSVCPGKVKVELCMLALLIGAVTSASIVPERRSVTAHSRAAYAALPASGVELPGSMRISSVTVLMILTVPGLAS